jgi:hypothetical protein
MFQHLLCQTLLLICKVVYGTALLTKNFSFVFPDGVAGNYLVINAEPINNGGVPINGNIKSSLEGRSIPETC